METRLVPPVGWKLYCASNSPDCCEISNQSQMEAQEVSTIRISRPWSSSVLSLSSKSSSRCCGAADALWVDPSLPMKEIRISVGAQWLVCGSATPASRSNEQRPLKEPSQCTISEQAAEVKTCELQHCMDVEATRVHPLQETLAPCPPTQRHGWSCAESASEAQRPQSTIHVEADPPRGPGSRGFVFTSMK